MFNRFHNDDFCLKTIPFSSCHYIVNFMMTSSNGNIFRLTGPLCGEFTGASEFSTQRPVTRSFDVFFDLRLNKRLSNNREAGDLRRRRCHYDVIVMPSSQSTASRGDRYETVSFVQNDTRFTCNFCYCGVPMAVATTATKWHVLYGCKLSHHDR